MNSVDRRNNNRQKTILYLRRIMIKLLRNRNIQSDGAIPEYTDWINDRERTGKKKNLLNSNGLNWICSNRKIICVKNAHFINHITNAHFIPLARPLSTKFDATATKKKKKSRIKPTRPRYEFNANFQQEKTHQKNSTHYTIKLTYCIRTDFYLYMLPVQPCGDLWNMMRDRLYNLTTTTMEYALGILLNNFRIS